MSQPKVSLGIVLYGTQYLRESLQSLLTLDYPDLEILLLDQEEGLWSAADLIQKKLSEVATDPRVQILRGPNLWHSGGHNRLIQHAKGEYYIVASNDMLYTPDCVARLVVALEQNPKAGSAAAKLKKWDSNEGKTDLLDSTGIEITATGRFADRGQGQPDSGQLDDSRSIWGASGALAAYRMTALLVSALGEDQFFDPALHYKNDVELSARLRAAGWQCRFAPQAVAYHARGLSVSSRGKSSAKVKIDSLFGQLYLVRRHWASLPGRVKLRHFALLAWAALWSGYWPALKKYLAVRRENLNQNRTNN